MKIVVDGNDQNYDAQKHTLNVSTKLNTTNFYARLNHFEIQMQLTFEIWMVVNVEFDFEDSKLKSTRHNFEIKTLAIGIFLRINHVEKNLTWRFFFLATHICFE